MQFGNDSHGIVTCLTAFILPPFLPTQQFEALRFRSPQKWNPRIALACMHASPGFMKPRELLTAGAIAACATTAAAAAVAWSQRGLAGTWRPTRTDEWFSLSTNHSRRPLALHHLNSILSAISPLPSSLAGKAVPARLRNVTTFISSPLHSAMTAAVRGPDWCRRNRRNTTSAAANP